MAKPTDTPAASHSPSLQTAGAVLGGTGVLWTFLGGYIGFRGDLAGWIGVGLIAVGGAMWFMGGLPASQRWPWLRSLGAALLVALVFRWGVAEPYRIPSGSMEPTLHGDPRWFVGDRVFVNKWVYGLRWPFTNTRIYDGADPKRWDIVVFQSAEENALHPTLVKRIVGMPGERIAIRGGRIYADGEPLELPAGMPADLRYTSNRGEMRYGVRPEPEYSVVPEGHYLVLGDNSGQSRDGRYFGWLPNGNILGPVTSIWWPVGRWRDFSGFSQTWWWQISVALVVVYSAFRIFAGRSVPIPQPNGRHEWGVASFLHLGFQLPFFRLRLITWNTPKAGDWVAFVPVRSTHTTEDELLSGRIVAVAGDKLDYKGGKPRINGAVLEAAGDTSGPNAPAKGAVAKGQCVVLHSGAHHGGQSGDPELETIPVSSILGVIIGVWWPLSRARRIEPETEAAADTP